jgi:hypothetical protein
LAIGLRLTYISIFDGLLFADIEELTFIGTSAGEDKMVDEAFEQRTERPLQEKLKMKR